MPTNLRAVLLGLAGATLLLFVYLTGGALHGGDAQQAPGASTGQTVLSYSEPIFVVLHDTSGNAQGFAAGGIERIDNVGGGSVLHYADGRELNVGHPPDRVVALIQQAEQAIR